MSTVSIPSNIIPRPRYLNRIAPWIRKPLVKVLSGPRQVGKSYILYQLIDLIQKDETDANIIYINLDDMEFASIKSALELHYYVKDLLKKDRWNYIFIDEIQKVEEGWRVPLSLRLQEKNDVYVTGSSANLFVSDLANAMGGRFMEFRVGSLCFLEFLAFHHLDNDDGSLALYERFGGLPFLINADFKAPETAIGYLRDTYATMLYRDVIERHGVERISFLRMLIVYLANNVGILISSKNVSNYLKSQNVRISQNQVAEYVNALVEACVVQEAERYNIVGKKIFEETKKYYFGDLGIRNTVVEYRFDDRGKRMENLVYNHLRCCEFTVMVGEVAGYEIDFICKRGAETLYIQVASELSNPETVAREFGNLLEIKGHHPKIVVSGEAEFHSPYPEVKHLYLRDFLCDEMTPYYQG